MAPSMSLCRATGKPATGLTSSRRRSTTRRTVAAHATPDDKPNAALLTLSAGALLAQSGVVDPAAAAQLAPSADHGVLASQQITTSKSNKFTSATAPSVISDLADLNADVRDLSKNYRDPAGAIQQDKFADKVQSGPSLGSKDLGDSIKSGLKDAKKKATDAVSALPTPAVGDLADLNADVRGAAKNYRDPAGAVQQDKFADKVSSGPSLGKKDLGESVKSGAKKAQRKAEKAFSALPTPAIGDLADLNADVRDTATDYRDPAIAVPQDKVTGKVQSGTSGMGSGMGSSDLGDSIKSGLKDAKKAATDAVSALPTPAVGDLADLNADVRGAAKNYRDPAGAIQQDKFADKVQSGPSLGSKDLGDSIKSGLKDAKKKATDAVSALPTPAVGDVADLGKGVRGASKNYRDPAGAVQQDKFAENVRSGSSSSGSGNLGSNIKSGLKDAKTGVKDATTRPFKSYKSAVSELPGTPLGDLADLNADVRDLSKNYRDPAGAIQQDKFADKVQSGTSGMGSSDLGDSIKSGLKDVKKKATDAVSALPTPAVGDLADLNADVRGAAKNYRDPAGAVQQDKFADKVSSGPSLGKKDLGESVKSGAKKVQRKAEKAFSALPTPAIGDLADLNSDVRGDASDYRDPAIAVPQDKVSGAVDDAVSGSSKPATMADKINKVARDNASNGVPKFSSSAPTPAVGDLADLNADVRGAAKNYRDPAGAIQQDKFADKVQSGPSLGSKDLGDSIKSGLKDAKKKATDAVSALPTPAVGDLADLNADVRGAAKNYRDPAGAVQQDKFADKVSSGPSLGKKDLGESVKSGAKKAQRKAEKAFSALPTPAVGDLADLNADVRDTATDYRDPAIAVPQDKVSDAISNKPASSALNTPDVPDLGQAADAAKKNLGLNKAFSALPTPAVGDLADLNADVRDLSKNYRDPAGAIQQDKFADKVQSGTSGMGSSDLGDSIKSGLKDAKKKATDAVSALPTPAVGDVADLNADVRDLSKNYRDPAGAIQQDKFADKVQSGTSGMGSSDLGDSIKSGLKDAKKKATDAVSALPTPAVGDLADLNADVRDLSKNYRDPAGAIQQDKFADKVQSGTSGMGSNDLGDSIKSGLNDAKKKATDAVSALPTPAVGDLADLNADVRGAAKNYRDPAGAIQQDKFADKVSSGPSLGKKDLGESVKSGAKKAQRKAEKAFSALPTPAVGDLADLNADVRDTATDYRDPAIAVPQDKVTGKVQSGTSGMGSGMGSSDLGDSIKSGLKDAKKAATDAVSALPTPAVGDLADLNADVRGAAKNYRDPAGAIQQDKFADKVSSGPSLGKKDLGESVKSGAKKAQRKAEKAFSAVPSHPLADLADLNADVRGDAADYRDPAGAVQQDTAADAVKSKVGNLSASKVSTPSAKRAGQKVLSNVTQTKREIGVKAGYGPSGSRVRDSTGKLINADDVRGTNPSIGNARLSQPLVRDSLGVKRVGSKNQTGAAGGSDSQGVVKPLKEVVDRVAN